MQAVALLEVYGLYHLNVIDVRPAQLHPAADGGKILRLAGIGGQIHLHVDAGSQLADDHAERGRRPASPYGAHNDHLIVILHADRDGLHYYLLPAARLNGPQKIRVEMRAMLLLAHLVKLGAYALGNTLRLIMSAARV